ncbi:hypothetical protein PTKIN_Ptkin04bG0015000 [Pterospermum kingtungense]
MKLSPLREGLDDCFIEFIINNGQRTCKRIRMMSGTDSYSNWNSCSASPILLTSIELAHRQQFFFWKNYQNNRLKFILPTPPPEPVSTPAPPPTAALPPQPPMPANTIAMTTAPIAPASALSPMPYGFTSGSSLAKNDMRNSGIDRRKTKHIVFYHRVFNLLLHVSVCI